MSKAEGYPRGEDDVIHATSSDNLSSEEAEFDAALSAVLASGLISGPDLSVVEEIRAEGESEGSGESEGEPGAETSSTLQPGATETERLAYLSELDERVEEIYQKIIARAPEHKVQPSLERVRLALDLMGNPQDAYRAIHVTGTNGKTSTARMIEALLREQGLRTGRFTSPHLTSVRERICLDGRAISREDFLTTWEDVEPFIAIVDERSKAQGGPAMSFFEVFTVMAYAAFAASPIDVAVIEVGMGGRWDATNVINADVAVLTPVALDHERWLGSRVEEIAEEKLGILKEGASLVCAWQSEGVRELVAERVRQIHAHLLLARRDLAVEEREVAVAGQLLTLRTPVARYEDVPLSLKGSFQAENAVLALAAVEEFFGGKALAGDVVEHAFMAVSSPGRLEVVRTSPTVIVDAAHNPHGGAATVDVLREYYPGTLVAVVGMMADKDVEGFLGVLEPACAHVVLTSIPSERAMPAEELAEIAKDVFGQERVHLQEDLLLAIDEAAALAESDPSAPMTYPAVVVLGSIQLVARARTLMGKPGADES